MKVLVRPHGLARQKLGPGPLTVELPPDATVEDLLLRLGLSPREGGLAALGGRMASPETRLEDGDEVALLSPAEGG